MSISGLVIHARPDRIDAVRAALIVQAGVEIHGASPDGRLVVTVDRPDDGAAAAIISGFQALEDVFSVALVYSHFDDVPAAKEQIHDPDQA